MQFTKIIATLLLLAMPCMACGQHLTRVEDFTFPHYTEVLPGQIVVCKNETGEQMVTSGEITWHFDESEGVLRLERSDVYICNVVKCRPPNNRDPEPDEVATCSPFLWRQLDAIQPAVVVGLGRFAIQTLLETSNSVGRLRGRAHPFRNAVLVPTYHPAYLLRNPEDKRKVFEDMKLVRKEFAERTGRELPPIVAGNKARSR